MCVPCLTRGTRSQAGPEAPLGQCAEKRALGASWAVGCCQKNVKKLPIRDQIRRSQQEAILGAVLSAVWVQSGDQVGCRKLVLGRLLSLVSSSSSESPSLHAFQDVQFIN